MLKIALSVILIDFSFLQKSIFYNEICFSRFVNELIKITRIIPSIVKKVDFGGKFKIWLEIILEAILGDSDYF